MFSLSKKIYALSFITTTLFSMTVSAKDTVTGAGATFPEPVYVSWAVDYANETGNQVNYQGIGSSGGVKQINARTVDFGASDKPLEDDKLKQDGLFQFPTVIGGVVLVVNIEGINSGELLLDGKTLGDIFLGNITKWDDPAIKQLNPTITLPSQNIAVVRRADGSGTSFVFTSYLNKVSDIWKDKVGAGSTVKWPTGLGGKGNSGVAAFVQRTPGAIGYVEYAYAKQNGLAYTQLLNADGKNVVPNIDSFSAAALNANWEESFAQDLTNQPGENAWPIASTTFILLHTNQEKPEQAKAVLDFFNWAYEQGDDKAISLDYAILPDPVVEKIKSAWRNEIKDPTGKPIFN